MVLSWLLSKIVNPCVYVWFCRFERVLIYMLLMFMISQIYMVSLLSLEVFQSEVYVELLV